MLHNYIPNTMYILLSRFLMKIAVVVILNLFQTVSYSGLSFYLVIEGLYLYLRHQRFSH